MDNVRILKGYSEQERKEIEEAEDNEFNNAMYLINRIVDYADDCTSLTKKYINGSSDENNQLARDIADYYAGVAKFPEQKYYLHLIKNDKYSYLNVTPAGGLGLSSRLQDNGWKTKFTHEEIISMNPQLLLFEEEVEDY